MVARHEEQRRAGRPGGPEGDGGRDDGGGDGDDGGGGDLRWYVVTGFVLAVVAGFLVAVWSVLSWEEACGKDLGGFAQDSLRADLCEGAASGVVVATLPVGWLAGAVLAAVALVRWSGSLPGTALLVLALLAPAGLPAATYAGLSATSTTCPAEELAAYREWVDAGGRGRPPHDCRTV